MCFSFQISNLVLLYLGPVCNNIKLLKKVFDGIDICYLPIQMNAFQLHMLIYLIQPMRWYVLILLPVYAFMIVIADVIVE